MMAVAVVWFLCLWLKVSDVQPLKITHLSVPGVLDVRGSASLVCDFDLETSKLYSVKWYKDDLEFCRFMPDGSPQVQIFNVEGVHINEARCNVTTVILNPLEFSTTGLYTCEVSTEAPYFKTVHTAANMTVLGIPSRNPTLTGLQDIYAVGDYVAGNCTSDSSYPPADILWYINDNQVESWQLDMYPQGSVDESGLRSSTMGIFFQVDHSHFSGKGNTMVLRCLAKVGDIIREVMHISKLADLDVKYAQGLFGNEGTRAESGLAVLVAVVITCVPLL